MVITLLKQQNYFSKAFPPTISQLTFLWRKIRIKSGRESILLYFSLLQFRDSTVY